MLPETVSGGLKWDELCLHPLFGMPTVGVLGQLHCTAASASCFALETADGQGCGGGWSQRCVGVFLIADWYRRELPPLGMPVRDDLDQVRWEDSLYRYTLLSS